MNEPTPQALTIQKKHGHLWMSARHGSYVIFDAIISTRQVISINFPTYQTGCWPRARVHQVE